jgi:hypothetical protein
MLHAVHNKFDYFQIWYLQFSTHDLIVLNTVFKQRSFFCINICSFYVASLMLRDKQVPSSGEN